MITYENLIVSFIEYQRKLISAFFQTFPNCRDTEWLLDFPRSGTITVGNETWKFQKHGIGICFCRTSGVPLVVDAHRDILDPEIIDYWRLVFFAESAGLNLEEEDFAQILAPMLKDGRVIECSTARYTLRP